MRLPRSARNDNQTKPKTMEKIKRRHLTLNDLLSNEYYRSLSLKELTEVINNELYFSGYMTLKGNWSHDKAKNLIDSWKEEKLEENSSDK